MKTNLIIGSGNLPDICNFIKSKKYDGFLLLTEKRVLSLYKETVVKLLAGIAPVRISAADNGEKAKDLINLPRLLKPFFEGKLTRNFCLVSLGGGAISDIGGFMASILLRGIDHIVIPTTLLCMVDAAIGGKNGLNFKHNGATLKNMIGTFRHPTLVISDTNFLKTLADREVSNGFAEIIKYKLLFGRPDLKEISASNFRKLPEKRQIALIKECQQLKMRLVAKDPFDTKGLRETLNLGHTVGHAVEGIFAGKFSHGEAVAIGLRAAAFISLRQKLIKRHEYDQILSLLKDSLLPVTIPFINPDKFNDLLNKDKKGGLMVLLKGIGRTVTGQKVDPQLMQEAIKEIQQ